jgi:two-component system cell cycle response regulator DivK
LRGGQAITSSGPRLRPRVLVVDDDPEIRALYAWCLRASGWTVGEADDGLEALEAVCGFAPDAVIMDVGLPSVNGLEVVRRLRADAETAQVRVVACTGESGHEAEAIESGCDAFVRKPCGPDDLRELLEELVFDRSPAGQIA